MQLNETFYWYNMHQQSQDPSPFPWPTSEQFGATLVWPGGEADFETRTGPTGALGTTEELKRMTIWPTCWISSL